MEKTKCNFGSVIAKRVYFEIFAAALHFFPLATFIWTHMIVFGLFSCCALLSVDRHQLKFFENHISTHNIFFILGNLGDWF